MPILVRTLLPIALLVASGCATLGLGIVPPRFALDQEQPSEIRLLGPSLARPVGGASLRLHALVENPNPVGITLVRIAGTLHLEGREAADVNFPLGVPLEAGASSVVPLDISVSFANLPLLAEALPSAMRTGEVNYALRGIVTVDAGVIGQPTFGPMTVLAGTVSAQQ